MNLDIERTEKNSQRVRSGHHRRFLGGLLDWVGLGYGGFLPVRYISHGLLVWKLLYCTREKFANAYIPYLGTVYML